METVVVIGIMVILLMVLTQIFALNYVFTVKQLARNDNDLGAITALRRLGDLTRGALTVETTDIINGTSYTSSADVLVLRLPAIDASGDIIVNIYDRMAVFRDASTASIIRTNTDIGSGSSRIDGTRLLTAYNDTMTFRYNDPSTDKATRVSVYMVNKQTVRGQTLQTKAWTSIFLRNR